MKENRLVDDTMGREKYKNIESLEWSDEELKYGKIIKIKSFPAEKKVKLFRVTVSTDRTDYVATNDLSQSSTDVVQQVKWFKISNNTLYRAVARPDYGITKKNKVEDMDIETKH